LGIALGGAWLWVRSWPKPFTVRATVIPPGLTPVEKKLVPRPMFIRFSSSAAPLDRIGKVVGTGIRMEPETPGRWVWADDTDLCFMPRNDWPAAQEYRVTFDRDALAPHVLLSSYRYGWKTPAFTAKVRDIDFYQDPRNPAVKQIVATIDFSHCVDPSTLAAHAGVEMLGRHTRESFDISFDAHHRTAYLRTKPIILPEREDYAKLTLSPGIRTVQGGATTDATTEAKCRVPDIYSFFRITDADTAIAWTDKGDPEQVLTVTTSCDALTPDLASALSMWILPKKPPTPDDPHPTWSSPREITPDVLAHSRAVIFEALPSRDPQTTTHAFRIHAPEAGQLYVRIDRGVRAPGDFVLGNAFDTVLASPLPPPTVSIEGDGAVLALSGERKLSVQSRGIPAIEYEIARVATSQINHLVSQTEGNFAEPSFRGWSFDEENISRIAIEHQYLANTGPFALNDSSFDLSPYLALPADGGSERGLFLLTARAWDPATKKPIRDVEGSRRFLLVTDLGLIVKENADESRDIFVASIHGGCPLPGVQVAILGKNGVPLVQATTDADGHANFPSVNNDDRDRKPVAFVARLGEDVAFLPYNRADRKLDFSRFDIGGDEVRSGADLDAFLFTERGIYRPGDEIHVGYIVKRHDWQKPPAGLPLEMEVVDARGRSVAVRRVIVPEGGFGEFKYATAPASATGRYTVNLYLMRDKERVGLLASASPWVKEFQPDRMKIAARLNQPQDSAWIPPEGVKALVSLRNLYGAPASQRHITATLSLDPGEFSFQEYPGYRFDDPLWKKWTSDDLRSLPLADAITNAKGEASIDLGLERLKRATYAMTLSLQGLEAGGGRGVGKQIDFLVSPLDHVVGCKADEDLSYIPMGSKRAVNFLAINRALKPVTVEGLTFRLIEETYLSVLKRQDNGNYAYESIERDNEVRTDARALPDTGSTYALPTDRPGTFRLEVRDSSDVKVSEISFTVVGKGDNSCPLERNAELRIKLPRREYQPGEDVEVSITAPYTGSGLITLERDRVYAQTWFTASATSSVQHLHIPADFEGTGYINVAFVRALDSKAIFMSPLSYAVEPITVGREKRRLDIQLGVPAEAKPGEPLAIHYRADRPGKIVIYAVDQGILQVNNYELPQPLDRFFRQTALMVGTSQIVDLILPEFSILRAAAAGGDADLLSQHLNPFRRVTEKPVVYWSGILDAGPEDRVATYDVPDFFDGTIKVMAVAYAPDATGSAAVDTLVRSRFVITPAAPTAIAPGDMFDVGVTVNNGGKETDVALTATASPELDIVKSPSMPLHLAKDAETTCTFTVRAKESLGSATLEFHASGDGEESRRRSTMSVRPAVPYHTDVQSAHFTGSSTELPVRAALRPEFRRAEATLSTLPLGLARGLESYLENYPYGCSEQLTSGAMCRLALSDEVDFGLHRADVAAQLEHTFDLLRQRQNDQGAFGYWNASASGGIDFLSVYVTQLLVEAKAAGFPPPADVLASAVRNLTRMVGEEQPGTLEEARVQAWAIYLLTREGVVTTNYIVNLRDTLESDYAKSWHADLTAVYLAGALELLQQDTEARKLISGYHCGRGCDGDFMDGLAADAAYVAILGRHFPDLLRRLPSGEFEQILKPIQTGRFSTFSAAAGVLALKSYSATLSQSGVDLAIVEVPTTGQPIPLSTSGTLLQRAEFSPTAKALRFSAGSTPLGAYCQVVETGFDAALPKQPESSGLEIYREFPKTARVGEPITVHIFLRTTGRQSVANVAVVDLLPGGFEVVGSSIQPGTDTLPGWGCVDVREDRVVVFGDAGKSAREISYQINPTCAGRFVVPPAFAEAMYDRGVHGTSAPSEIEVSAR
jgi:hypothetical protein